MALKDINWDYFNNLLQSGTKEEFDAYLVSHDLTVKDGKIVAKETSVLERLIEYWDKGQHIKKINLNSLYGALLNSGCRFFDKRIGQSTTLTGRQIVKHMTGEVNQIIDGSYDHLGKSIIYNDTDSVYFSAYKSWKNDIDAGKIPWDKDTVVTVYDQIGEVVNESFPAFMEKSISLSTKSWGSYQSGSRNRRDQ